MPQFIKEHVFRTEPSKTKENEGDYVEISSRIYQNDTGDIFLNQDIRLISAYDDGSIELWGSALTPTQLREFADQLEEAISSARAL